MKTVYSSRDKIKWCKWWVVEEQASVQLTTEQTSRDEQIKDRMGM
jgi:hypothetical protein